MDKGIRPACNAKFLELLPQRAEMGNTEFRRAVMQYVMDEFNITLASAATHYNHAFKQVKANNPDLVEGLGRPEDKKGGRKKKVAAVATDFVDAESVVQTAFTVKKKATGEVVAENVTFDEARAMVEKAIAQRKAKLYWV